MAACARLVMAVMCAIALLATAACGNSSCPRDCRTSLHLAHDACRAACPAGRAGNDCRSACRAERHAERTLCRSATEQAAPSCGLGDLYVASSAARKGAGTSERPFRRITDAVAQARAVRAFGVLPSGQELRIHVGEGTYVGSFDADALNAHPEYEVLPIILNVRRLTLVGETTLVVDERGLPTDAAADRRTTLEPDQALRPNQYLVLVTRTADGAVGDDVTVAGFVLDGIAGDLPGADLFIDRVSNFSVRNNVVRRSAFGVMTRLASGTIEENLLADNLELGAIVTGGSAAHPATVLVRGNRVTRNGAHGIGTPVAGWIKLTTDRGQNSLALHEPLQTVFDRGNPADLPNIPDSLNVTISDNDASDNFNATQPLNGGIGLRLSGIWPDFAYDTADASQPVTSHLTAQVSGNTCERNGAYGFVLEAADTKRVLPRRFIQTLTVDLSGNTFVDNGRASALVTFNYWIASTSRGYVFNKFAEASTYTLTDDNGALAGFDYDHPVADPISGTVLGNRLVLNGVEISNGKVVSPIQ